MYSPTLEQARAYAADYKCVPVCRTILYQDHPEGIAAFLPQHRLHTACQLCFHIVGRDDDIQLIFRVVAGRQRFRAQSAFSGVRMPGRQPPDAFFLRPAERLIVRPGLQHRPEQPVYLQKFQQPVPH